MKTIKIKCPRCKHEWKTESKLRLVTCASCGIKVVNPIYVKNIPIKS